MSYMLAVNLECVNCLACTWYMSDVTWYKPSSISRPWILYLQNAAALKGLILCYWWLQVDSFSVKRLDKKSVVFRSGETGRRANREI